MDLTVLWLPFRPGLPQWMARRKHTATREKLGGGFRCSTPRLCVTSAQVASTERSARASPVPASPSDHQGCE